MSTTVQDFRAYLLQQAGVDSHLDFCKRSPECRDFWRKINELGARNMEKQPPETVPDIDETVILTPEEWLNLDGELHELLTRK